MKFFGLHIITLHKYLSPYGTQRRLILILFSIRCSQIVNSFASNFGLREWVDDKEKRRRTAESRATVFLLGGLSKGFPDEMQLCEKDFG